MLGRRGGKRPLRSWSRKGGGEERRDLVSLPVDLSPCYDGPRHHDWDWDSSDELSSWPRMGGRGWQPLGLTARDRDSHERGGRGKQ